jgi:hypothetical protein
MSILPSAGSELGQIHEIAAARRRRTMPFPASHP